MNQDVMKYATQLIGIDFSNLEQGSEDWLVAKLGVMSASEAHAILSGAKTQTKKTYIAKKIGQVITGIPEDEFNAKALQWGKENEAAARTGYSFVKGKEVKEVGFTYKDMSLREGCSPDGQVKGERHFIEIKCPFTTEVYVKMACFDQIKPEWEKQVQYSMRVLDVDQYDFVIYDPRVMRDKIIFRTFERDDKVQSLFEEATQEIIYAMDSALNEIGYMFGDQWKDRIQVAKRLGISA